jgi:hypothetical protein
MKVHISTFRKSYKRKKSTFLNWSFFKCRFFPNYSTFNKISVKNSEIQRISFSFSTFFVSYYSVISFCVPIKTQNNYSMRRWVINLNLKTILRYSEFHRDLFWALLCSSSHRCSWLILCFFMKGEVICTMARLL